MDFFARQDSARRQTAILLIYFALAVLGTSALVYAVVLTTLAIGGFGDALSLANGRMQLWHPTLFLFTFLTTLGVVVIGSLVKKTELADGGARVAAMLGAKPIQPNSRDFYEVRLRNVVEEMAIASGVPVPRLYVMKRERGINAFAAGYRVGDAVIAVTYGTLVGLKRAEPNLVRGEVKLPVQFIQFLWYWVKTPFQ